MISQKILVIGSGAREHSIVRAISRSSHPNDIFCIGKSINPGIAELCKEFVVENFNKVNIVSKYATDNNISMAIVGPENPLQEGLADALWASGVPVIGPKKNLAKIETSKAFTRNLLKKYNIPGGPKFKVFKSIKGVQNFLKELGENYVVKFDGLA